MCVVVDRIFAMADEEGEAQERKRERENAARRRRHAAWRAKQKNDREFPPKRVGEIGELEFIQKALRKGFGVSKPWGDSDRYDAVTDWDGTLSRVQVRATEHPVKERGYMVHASVEAGEASVGLTDNDIDVLAAYIFPEDIWYIVPVEHFVPLKNLWFSPGSKKAKFEKFREAWDWLQRKTKRKIRGRR